MAEQAIDFDEEDADPIVAADEGRSPAQAAPPVMVNGKAQKSTALPVPEDRPQAVYHGSIPNTYDQGSATNSPDLSPTNALHGGLSFIQKVFGLDKGEQAPAYDPRMGNDIYFADAQGRPTQAYPLDPRTGRPIPGAQPGQQIPGAITNDSAGASATNTDPNHGVRMLSQYAGAMSNEEYTQLRKIVDPDGKLDDSLANVAMMNGMYNYYLDHGDPEKAAKASASMIMKLAQISSTLGASALEAMRRGDIPQAAELVKKAYGFIPDGNSATSEGNQVTIRDMDGNVVHQGAFTPKQLFEAAVGIKTGSAYWNALIQQASKKTGVKPEQLGYEAPAPSVAYTSAMSGLGGGSEGASTGTAPASTGAVPAQPSSPPAASAAPAQAIPASAPTAQAIPTGAPPVQPANGNVLNPNYQLPIQEVSLPGDNIPSAPVAPNPDDPQYALKQPVDTSTFGSDKERRDYYNNLRAHNAPVRAAWQSAQQEYKNAVAGRQQAIKEGGFKPGSVHSDAFNLIKENISTAITDAMGKYAVNPATGQKFTPEEATSFLGPHLNTITALGAGLAADNPHDASLQDPTTAGAVAMGLALNPAKPEQPNFRVLGRTPGGEGIVIETDDNPPRKFAMSQQNFSTLVGTMRALTASYVGQKEDKGRRDLAQATRANSLYGITTALQGIGHLEQAGVDLAKRAGNYLFGAPPKADAASPDDRPPMNGGYGGAGQPYQMPVVNPGEPDQAIPEHPHSVTPATSRHVSVQQLREIMQKQYPGTNITNGMLQQRYRALQKVSPDGNVTLDLALRAASVR